MKWGARALTGIVRAAPFPAEHETEAVALALATSGGDDQYEHRPGTPGVGDTRGLWGIDVDRWPAFDAWNLFDPRENATAAMLLTTTYGHFGWSPVAHTGAHHHLLGEAATARTHTDLWQTVPGPLERTTGHRPIGVQLDAMRRFRQ